MRSDRNRELKPQCIENVFQPRCLICCAQQVEQWYANADTTRHLHSDRVEHRLKLSCKAHTAYMVDSVTLDSIQNFSCIYWILWRGGADDGRESEN